MAKIIPASPLLGRGESASEGFIIAALVMAAIYAGAKVFAPLALAVLLAFVLTPPIQTLRRFGLPRVAATLMMVISLLAGAAVTGAILTSQVATLSEDLPKYQRTLKEKIHDLRDARLASKSMERAGQALSNLQNELAKSEVAPTAAQNELGKAPSTPIASMDTIRSAQPRGAQAGDVTPVPVVIHQPEPSALE